MKREKNNKMNDNNSGSLPKHHLFEPFLFKHYSVTHYFLAQCVSALFI